jgi:hypothetical protein
VATLPNLGASSTEPSWRRSLRASSRALAEGMTAIKIIGTDVKNELGSDKVETIK